MCDRRHLSRAGTQEEPKAGGIANIALSELENFCEHSFGRKQRQSAIVVGLDARSVPFVAAIDECKNGDLRVNVGNSALRAGQPRAAGAT
jgi:hypothetical protein